MEAREWLDKQRTMRHVIPPPERKQILNCCGGEMTFAGVAYHKPACWTELPDGAISKDDAIRFLEAYAAEAVAAEREACATLIDADVVDGEKWATKLESIGHEQTSRIQLMVCDEFRLLAATIRARGEKGENREAE